MPSNNPLPPKEAALFRKLLKCYEMKQYKNGLKMAKQILSNPKCSEHGETLAMKGLTLNGLGRREEAYTHVRIGLRNDLRSHVCWHVYGLLQRSDKKYDEAIKCYRNALKWEKDNLQILKDLSLLQIQMRDLEGYKETRHHLFTLRPSQHASWIGYAMSYHLLGELEMAHNVLDTFIQSQMPVEPRDYRNSELLLYQNLILVESGNVQRAIDHLIKYDDQIVDKLAVQETLGDLYLKLNESSKATAIFEALIKRNPENTHYYDQYMLAKGIVDPDDQLDQFEEFQIQYPRSNCARRLPLNIATGDRFRAVLDEFLRPALRKGIPPLFVSVSSLYKDADKVRIIEGLIEQYLENLLRSGHFSREDSDNNLPVEPATTIVWSSLFLAQHYDHKRDAEKALEYINMALEHTPTLIELLITKGRIYKHAGDPIKAYMWLEEAQSMDTADRYINSKCAKYMLRANLLREAEEVCAKFTREGVTAMENLNEMQCMWFQTECALAYQRMSRWGDALKKCHEIDRHFTEIIEDQFDFHTYCMRKMTLRAYIGLLRLEDVLRHHPFYFKAAKCAIEVYISLYDKPLKSEESVEEIDYESLPPSELKKLKSKQRKAKKKAELEHAQAAQAQVKREQHQKSKQASTQEADPEAVQLDELIPGKLERPEDPLQKAIEFLTPLQLYANERIETHFLAFEIYFRKRKVLLLLQAINRMRAIDVTHPTVHTAMVRLGQALPDLLAEAHERVRSIAESVAAQLFGGKSPQQLNADFIAANKTSAMHLFEGAYCMSTLEPSKRAEAIQLILTIDPSKVTLKEATKIYHALCSSDIFGECTAEIEQFKEACRSVFPLARLFMTTEESAKAPQLDDYCAAANANKAEHEDELVLEQSNGGGSHLNNIDEIGQKMNSIALDGQNAGVQNHVLIN